MKKSVYRIIIIAALGIFVAVCIFACADILKSRQMVLQQAEDAINYMSENCADEFSAIFDNAELLVDDTVAVVEEMLEADSYLHIDADSEAAMNSVKSIIRQFSDNSQYPISLYVMFNPEYIKDDIWYVKQLDGKVEDLSGDDAEIEEWLREWNDEKSMYGEFYRDAVEAGELWFEAGYEPDISWEVVTRTKAVYDKEGNLIGVVGADVYLGDISEKLESIDEKTGGISAVINSDGELIAGDELDDDIAEDERYISSSSEIGKLWTVTIAQPVKVATGSIRNAVAVTVILGATVFLMLAAMGMLIYKRHGKPIIRAFEEKDILIINQARQAQLGEMVGNIAHQLKQPLNGVNMALSNLQDDYCDSVSDEEQDDFRMRIERMKKRIAAMAETVDSFMDFLRPKKESMQFDVKDEICSMLELMQESMQIDMIDVDISGDDFRITGHKNEFGQCIFNILDNARAAMQDNDTKQIKIVLNHITNNDGKETGSISIRNNGENIPEKLLEKIFDLYFTTNEETGGKGIGLYMTKSIIEKHFAGTIECRNEEDGVCFKICVPLEEKTEVNSEERKEVQDGYSQ